MSQSKQISLPESNVSIAGLVLLAVIFLVGLFVIAFDQGHALSLVYGEQAFDDLFIHELTHDMRHAAGFPCH